MISKVEATHRKKKKKKSKSQALLFTSLPEEIIENILARLSRYNYPKLSLVSKSFHSLLTSSSIYKTRARIGTTETRFFICLESRRNKSQPWFYLQAKPNQIKTKRYKKNSSRNVLVPIVSTSYYYRPVPSSSTIVVGLDIYVIGGSFDERSSSSIVRVLDSQSLTWRRAPNMKVGRMAPAAGTIDGKVYVLGGCERNYSDHWLEVFDIKTQSWTSFTGPCHKPEMHPVVNVIQGKLHVMTTMKEYMYDPKQGTWTVVRELSMYGKLGVRCVLENVIYCCTEEGDCMWYDTRSGKCEMIKGLEKLRKHPQHGLSSGFVHALLNYNGNLLVIWEPKQRPKKTKVWYAEISLEKRCNGSEIWGNILWVDVMFTFAGNSFECPLCLNVSV